jgi:carbonic anhydrase/acetyltransferase-like protein (isoleucine patch superfamily)
MSGMPLYALGTDRPRIHPQAYVHPNAVLVGEVLLGPYASVWPGVVIRADNGPIIIGPRTSIQDGTVIHTQPDNPTQIGSECVVGHLAHLEGCLLEDWVLVGSGAVVLERVACRSPSLVGAGAVVPAGMEVPPGAMALGVPARLRSDTVSQAMVSANVNAYLKHLAQHRDGSRPVALADCLEP